MRRVATAAILAIATIVRAHNSASRQTVAPNNPPVTTRVIPTPLGWYAMGGIVCAAVSPMIGTLMLGRELTVTEVDRMALSCFLGPVGWVLGPVLFPDPIVTTIPPLQIARRPQGTRQARGRHIDIPPPGETRFGREVLLELEPGTPEQYIG